jgi:endoglucanase
MFLFFVVLTCLLVNLPIAGKFLFKKNQTIAKRMWLYCSSLLLLFVFFLNSATAQTFLSSVRLNQVGYYPNERKVAVVVGDVAVEGFEVVSIANNKVMFTGNLGPQKKSAYSATNTREIDFTNLTTAGQYKVRIPGLGESCAFLIKQGIYHDAGVATIKAFYYQRASMALTSPYAGKWKRAMGHPDDKVLIHPSAVTASKPAGTIIKTPRGWYDAGDYNKYVVNSGISTGTLLSAYEDFSSYFDTLKTNIPESGNQVPDILDEALYNIRWMLTMQDQDDGGVYNKCTNAVFDAMVMPEMATSQRYVVQKGTAATLDFTAVMAQSARIFKRFNKALPGLSDSCLAASLKAWQWSVKNPSVEYNQDLMNTRYTPIVLTGGYGDRKFSDEKFWAAAELAATTGSTTDYTTILTTSADQTSVPSWNNVGMLGYYTLIRCNMGTKPPLSQAVEVIKKRLIAYADNLINHVAVNAFGCVMGQSKNDFIWGSNAVAANQGIILINAYLATHDNKYLQYALTNVDYLLGKNATGYCFITGIGSKSPMHPHHRPSVADGIVEPVPGLLVAGANPGRQDGSHYDYTEPETAYQDVDTAYASNEIAINWNAPVVYLLNAMEALQHHG